MAAVDPASPLETLIGAIERFIRVPTRAPDVALGG
jgi:hypothetical protein